MVLFILHWNEQIEEKFCLLCLMTRFFVFVLLDVLYFFCVDVIFGLSSQFLTLDRLRMFAHASGTKINMGGADNLKVLPTVTCTAISCEQLCASMCTYLESP